MKYISKAPHAEPGACRTNRHGRVRDELRHTASGVGPKDVYGADFLGRTFRVLKGKGVKRFGEQDSRNH